MRLMVQPPWLRRLAACAVRPTAGFHQRREEDPTLTESLRILVWVRFPVTLASWLLSLFAYTTFHQDLVAGRGFVVEALRRVPELASDPELGRALAEQLPAPPTLLQALPWMLVLIPIAVLSLWLHDAVWDHTCLWMLRAVPLRGTFRRTAIADAEALQVASFGVLFGLLSHVPLVGMALGLPLMALAAYFWIIRGCALAAWHGCPLWKGLVATLLHAALAGVAFLLLLVASWFLARAMVG